MKRVVLLFLLCGAGACGGGNVTGTAAPGQTPQKTEVSEAPPPPERHQKQRVFVGFGRLCGVTEDYRLWCMGNNSLGQLGDGTTVDRAEPVEIRGVGYVSDVALGLEHTCARNTAGEVYCWGDNAQGQLGTGSLAHKLRPTKVAGLEGVVDLSAGFTSTVARAADGSLFCWGSPCLKDLAVDELDVPTLDRRLEVGCVGAYQEHCLLAPAKLPHLTAALQVSLGYGHLCGLSSEGQVSCVGHNGRGELGLMDRGGQRLTKSRVPVSVPGVGKAVELRSFGDQTCALEDTGALHCWGPEKIDVDGPETSTVRQLAQFPDAVAFARNNRLACAITDSGDLSCVTHGESIMAEAREGGPLRTFDLPIVSDAVDIAMDDSIACVAREEGTVLCSGKLPGATTVEDKTLRWTAEPVPGLGKAKSVTAGMPQSCSVLENGGVSCFGRWIKHHVPGDQAPETVPRLKKIAEVDVGITHACARRENGTVRCWSFPVVRPDGPPFRYGILGNGTTNWSFIPVDVSDLDGVTQLALETWHTCALRQNGRVSCWGLNDMGQLGDGTREDRLEPVEVLGLDKVTQIAVGRSHSCARRDNGQMVCWGGNGNGQLGDGTLEAHLEPQPVKGLSDVTEIGVGLYSSCALQKNGQVFCWGFLGCDCDYGNHQQKVPQQIKTFGPAKHLWLNGRIPCIETKSGQIQCHSLHTYVRDFAPPGRARKGRWAFDAPLPEPPVHVAPGNTHVCATSAQGQVSCWGHRDLIGLRPIEGLFVIHPPQG